MSAILTGTKHATPKPRIVDPSEVKVESGIPFPKTRCRPGTKWGPDASRVNGEARRAPTGRFSGFPCGKMSKKAPATQRGWVAARMLAQSIKPKTLYKRSD